MRFHSKPNRLLFYYPVIMKKKNHTRALASHINESYFEKMFFFQHRMYGKQNRPMGIFRLVQCVFDSQGTYLCIICGVEMFPPRATNNVLTHRPFIFMRPLRTINCGPEKLTDRRVIERPTRPTGNVLGNAQLW